MNRHSSTHRPIVRIRFFHTDKGLLNWQSRRSCTLESAVADHSSIDPLLRRRGCISNPPGEQPRCSHLEFPVRTRFTTSGRWGSAMFSDREHLRVVARPAVAGRRREVSEQNPNSYFSLTVATANGVPCWQVVIRSC